MASYRIHRLTKREEMDAVVDVAWKAWHEPYLALERLLYPIFDYTAADRERSIDATKDRLWAGHPKQTTDNRYWLYVRHIDGGLLQLNFDWWPEEEEIKVFCEEMITQATSPRSIWTQRPHGSVSNFVVHPDCRGQGIGRALMQYHTNELDRRGIEGFVEASQVGRSVYEKVGYQVVMKYGSFIPAGKSDDWKRQHYEMGPEQFFTIWRPKYSRVAAGERNKPWQMGPSLPIK